MKKRVRLLFLSILMGLTAFSQTPQSFKYQAVLRDNAGDLITGQTVQVRISILAGSDSGTPEYSEVHTVQTNDYGLVSFNIGEGSNTTGSFTGILWGENTFFIQIEVDPNNSDSYTTVGSYQLLSVPYALYANSAGASDSMWDTNGNNISYSAGNVGIGSTSPLSRLEVKEDPANDGKPLFEVVNANDDTVFAVYRDGVKVFVDNTAKGNIGGFAVSGRTTAKGEEPYLIISPDSARIYVNEPANPGKGNIGGFAVSGRTTTKQSPSSFLMLTPNNYFIGHEAGVNTTTGLYNNFIGYYSGHYNTEGDYNVFLGRYTGYWNTVGTSNIFLGDMAGYYNTTGSANVFIGDMSGYENNDGIWNIFLGRNSGASNTSGSSNIIVGDFAGVDNSTGGDNVIIGDWAGANNTIGNENIFMGTESGWTNTEGNNNIFLGAYSGYSNTTGSWNVFMGENSGYSNTRAVSNVFLGQSAGYGNDTGSYNVFIGTLSGTTNVGGKQNVFVGQESGKLNTTGSFNTFFGAGAGFYNTTANSNAFYGAYTGYETTTGAFNSFYGTNAGKANTTGTQNVYIGQQSGEDMETGNYNVYVGAFAGGTNTSGNHNVFLGYGAGYSETGSDRLYIDNAGNDYTAALIYGNFNTGYLRINADTYIYGSLSYTSDKRLKKNISNIDNSLESILQLQGVQYEWDGSLLPKREFSSGIQYGLIAQDVEEIIPAIVQTDQDGFKTIDYIKLTPYLIEAMKEQQSQIEEQKSEIEELRKENASIKKQLNDLKLKIDRVLMEQTAKIEQPEPAKKNF